MVSIIICEVGTIICDIGTINVRFYQLGVRYPHGYCRITLYSNVKNLFCIRLMGINAKPIILSPAKFVCNR